MYGNFENLLFVIKYSWDQTDPIKQAQFFIGLGHFGLNIGIIGDEIMD
jgi:hypothetical protein